MTGAMVVFAVGAVLELVGFVIAARGFWQTWHEHSDDERFLQPLVALVQPALSRLRKLIAGLTCRPGPGVVYKGNSDSVGSTDSALVQTQYGDLPSLVDSPKAFADEVNRRINRVSAQLQDQSREMLAAATQASEKLRTELTVAIDKVERVSRSVAIGGLRKQVVGWSAIVVGFVLQVVATFMQISA